jgi:hypothetical protein
MGIRITEPLTDPSTEIRLNPPETFDQPLLLDQILISTQLIKWNSLVGSVSGSVTRIPTELCWLAASDIRFFYLGFFSTCFAIGQPIR